jgi:triacylglycerol esterase/lipase EstA (alpha/beta hydrolase family)
MERLEARGIPFVAVTLEPPFGSIDRYRAPVETAVARLEAATGRGADLVGHSMGGLAIRAWRASRGNARRGSPHRHDRHAAPRHLRSPATRAPATVSRCAIGSGLARAARAGREGDDVYRAFTCFWGHCDNIVFPTRGATLPGADNRHIAATPHVAMAFHPEVFDYVVQAAETR